MRTVGHVATYPARIDSLPIMLNSIVGQVDEIVVVCNEFADRDLKTLPRHPNVTYFVPDADLKDTGKFFPERDADDHVFLLDDDIEFPPDYVEAMIALHRRLPGGRFVVGLHGVVYSDLFDGAPQSRFVAKFDRALERPLLVNQLGTGCASMRGDLLPPFDLMSDAQRFVDVRFARVCHERGIAMVCMPRRDGWLRDLEPADSIFESYTRLYQREQTEEVLAFGGFGRLDPALAVSVERL